MVVGGFDIPAEDNQLCYFNEDISTGSMLTVDVYANNSVGSTKTSYENGGVFCKYYWYCFIYLGQCSLTLNLIHA